MQLSMRLQAGGLQSIELADAVFACKFNEPLLHQVVTACLANNRQGTRAQKNRSDVRGGGKKPWKQKGTGRARAGSIRSPIWRGGGVTFAARPQDYTQKVNKKMYRSALRVMLSALVQSERLIVTDDLSLSSPKTRLLIARLQELNVKKTMIVSHEIDENLYLASRNLPEIIICEPRDLNPAMLVQYSTTLITLAALRQLEEKLI